MCNLENCFYKKVDFGRKLVLSESLIMQGLTDDLTAEYQNVLIVNHIDTDIECYRVANKSVQSPAGVSVRNMSETVRPTSFANNAPWHWVRPRKPYFQPINLEFLRPELLHCIIKTDTLVDHVEFVQSDVFIMLIIETVSRLYL